MPIMLCSSSPSKHAIKYSVATILLLVDNYYTLHFVLPWLPEKVTTSPQKLLEIGTDWKEQDEVSTWFHVKRCLQAEIAATSPQKLLEIRAE